MAAQRAPSRTSGVNESPYANLNHTVHSEGPTSEPRVLAFPIALSLILSS